MAISIAALVVGGAVSGVFLGALGSESPESQTVAASQKGEAPAVGTDLGEPVVDSAGVFRGYVSEAVEEELAEGAIGHPVHADNGKLVGYFVYGHLGFVDLETAGDPTLLLELESCYAAYAERLEVRGDCGELLTAQGVDVSPAYEAEKSSTP